VAKIARLPLMYEPGTTWEYSHSVDVLGRVVEVVSGQDLAEFIDARISRPLGLRDTGFAATGERAARIAEPQIGPRPPMHYRVADPGRRWAEGGGGAVSTAADFVRFCQMLVNGGELDGTRLLAPKTVALMTSDHLPPGCNYGDTARERFGVLAPVPEMGYGFGLGFAVRTAAGRCPLPGSVGEYFWGGVLGTAFWIDPVEELVVVAMMVAPERRLYYRHLLRPLVYGAVVGSVPR
jgi:CubicO group peptidase (beta-lactamase class C family)